MPFLLGGLFIGVLSALPIVGFCNCCCLWVLGGGVLSAYLEQQNRPVSLTIWEGARIGFLAGVIGAVIWVVLDYALSPLQARFFGEVLRNVRDVPPELQEWLEMAEEAHGARQYSGVRAHVDRCVDCCRYWGDDRRCVFQEGCSARARRAD